MEPARDASTLTGNAASARQPERAASRREKQAMDEKACRQVAVGNGRCGQGTEFGDGRKLWSVS